MQNLKRNDTNELVYKTETNLQILENKTYGHQEGRKGGSRS